jgi:hypothetical protein
MLVNSIDELARDTCLRCRFGRQGNGKPEARKNCALARPLEALGRLGADLPTGQAGSRVAPRQAASKKIVKRSYCIKYISPLKTR